MLKGKIPAWQQGEMIEATCSLYSILNAIRQVTEDGVLTEDEVRELVWHPLQYLDDFDLLLRVFQKGAGVRLFRELLALVAYKLGEQFPISLDWYRPFLRPRRLLRRDAIIRKMKRHLGEPRTSIIVLVWRNGKAHWTVISSVRNGAMELRDSTGQIAMKLRDVSFARRRKARAPVTAITSAMFFVRLIASGDE